MQYEHLDGAQREYVISTPATPQQGQDCHCQQKLHHLQDNFRPDREQEVLRPNADIQILRREPLFQLGRDQVRNH